MTTIFSKIISGELPAEKLYENEHVIAIKDINPAAPVHVLIITKKEIADFHALMPEDYFLLGEMAKAAHEVAVDLGIEDGYRLLTNIGPSAGQTIFHLHFHLIGGRELGRLG